MIRSSLRIALVALALATVGGTTQASAQGFGPGFGPGFGFHHGFGFRPRWAFGGPFVRYPVYAPCTVRRFINFEGDVVIRRVCF